MFQGTLPTESIQQMFSILEDTQKIYVCCSGTFKFEQAFYRINSKVQIISNDVSLYSCALGNYLINAKFKRLDFVNKLHFLQEYKEKNNLLDPFSVAALIVVAFEVSKYVAEKNDFQRSRLEHWKKNLPAFFNKAQEKINKALSEIKISNFFARDWLEHIEAAKKEDTKTSLAIVAFPPTYKAGYERQFKLLSENVKWDAPNYEIFDPKTLPSVLENLRTSNINYCVYSDTLIEGFKPVAIFNRKGFKEVYLYASSKKTSYIKSIAKRQIFKYKPVNVRLISKDSVITVIKIDSSKMNFLKDVYLSKRILHSSGMFNFLVYVDDMLAGGFIFSMSKFGSLDEIYLLSDFSLSREAKLSKLIALISTSENVIKTLRQRLLLPIKHIYTTAFSLYPVSMKYRSIFHLVKRVENEEKDGFMLNYISEVRPENEQEIFIQWWKKYGKKSIEKLNHDESV